MNPAVHQWQDMTTEDFRMIDPETSMALLPMAATEQHGPHLPLSTDAVICQGILDAALSQSFETQGSVIVLPLQGVGDSLEHTDFPGTLSLSADTVTEVIFQLGTCVRRTGIRKLLIFNSHGGQTQVIDIAALKLRQEFKMFVAKAHSFRFGLPEGIVADDELRHGLHGGAVETSMMLHLAPDLVRQDKVSAFGSIGQVMARDNNHLGPEGPRASFAWSAQDLNPSGTTGDATIATAEMGRRMVAHAADTLRQVIHEVQSFPMTILIEGS